MAETTTEKLLGVQVTLAAQARLIYEEADALEKQVKALKLGADEKASLLVGIRSIRNTATKIAPHS